MKSSKSFIQRYFKKLSGRLLLLLLLFIVSLFVFTYILDEVVREGENNIDFSVFHFLSLHVINPQLTLFMKAVTYCASANFLQIAYAVVIVGYLLNKDWKRAGEIGVIGMGGFLINYFMKLTFHRPRPSDPLIKALTNFSFPSGHATSGFIFYGLLSFLVWKTKWPPKLKWTLICLLIFFALLIGFSRIYLRMHYTSDVVAGFAVGTSWLVLCIWLMETLKKKTHEEVVKN
jgi:membrane-associated phospholipid phosphatase